MISPIPKEHYPYVAVTALAIALLLSFAYQGDRISTLAERYDQLEQRHEALVEQVEKQRQVQVRQLKREQQLDDLLFNGLR